MTIHVLVQRLWTIWSYLKEIRYYEVDEKKRDDLKKALEHLDACIKSMEETEEN